MVWKSLINAKLDFRRGKVHGLVCACSFSLECCSLLNSAHRTLCMLSNCHDQCFAKLCYHFGMQCLISVNPHSSEDHNGLFWGGLELESPIRTTWVYTHSVKTIFISPFIELSLGSHKAVWSQPGCCQGNVCYSNAIMFTEPAIYTANVNFHWSKCTSVQL